MATYAPCKRAPPCASVGNSIPYTVCLVLSQYDKRASERAETLRRPSEEALVCASESRRSVQSPWSENMSERVLESMGERESIRRERELGRKSERASDRASEEREREREGGSEGGREGGRERSRR